MEYQVPALSVVFMGIAALAGVAIPILLFLYFRKRYRADALPFFIGCAVFLVFALILESLAHNLILASPAGAKIQSDPWLFGAYGGLMAGLFEEVGRFLAFKSVLKKKLGRDVNALMYGAGHGGFEVLAVLGLTMISNLTVASMINLGMTEQLTANVADPAALAQMQAQFAALASTAPAMFLAGVVERFAAVALHLSFSVLVWFAVKQKGKTYLFPLAILLHALVDMAVVVLGRSVSNVWLIEGAVYVMAAACALVALAVWKRCASPEGPQPEPAPPEGA
ncbi:MAG TPA: YhfC family glutamic-type intramembrane protease [Clostridia bacterium]|nr:YhfC family glutamic-type intramembrane protease [Clostridia bacterium]